MPFRTAAQRHMVEVEAARTARRHRPVVGITFSRTKRNRVRFLTVGPEGSYWSQSYASRQGARRAAKRQNRGRRIAWGKS